MLSFFAFASHQCFLFEMDEGLIILEHLKVRTSSITLVILHTDLALEQTRMDVEGRILVHCMKHWIRCSEDCFVIKIVTKKTLE